MACLFRQPLPCIWPHWNSGFKRIPLDCFPSWFAFAYSVFLVKWVAQRQLVMTKSSIYVIILFVFIVPPGFFLVHESPAIIYSQKAHRFTLKLIQAGAVALWEAFWRIVLALRVTWVQILTWGLLPKPTVQGCQVCITKAAQWPIKISLKLSQRPKSKLKIKTYFDQNLKYTTPIP